MSQPISTARVRGGARDELPAYLANGRFDLDFRPSQRGITIIITTTGMSCGTSRASWSRPCRYSNLTSLRASSRIIRSRNLGRVRQCPHPGPSRAAFPGKARLHRDRLPRPCPACSSRHEDHVSLDIARAFAFHATVTGDLAFLREKAWPVLSCVPTGSSVGFRKLIAATKIKAAMGIAEREQEADNAAFTCPRPSFFAMPSLPPTD